MRRKSWVLTSVVFLVAAALLMCIRPVQAETHWGANYFPNVELTDQYGNKLHFYDDLLKGKIVAIELFYTHCIDMCPLETARLAQVQRMLGDRVGKDIFFYSLSIDPKRDTPEEMKAYAEKYHAGPGWLFLTGKQEDVVLITKKLGLYKDPDPEDRDGHTTHLLLGNEATGQWMRNNALDNPRLLSVMIGDWLKSWTNAKPIIAGTGYAEAVSDQKIKYDPGRYIFYTQCEPCHTIGGGESIGPDLRGLTKIRDPQWLRKIVQVPEELLDKGDPLANALLAKYKGVRMPNLHFSDSATDLLIKYMDERSTALESQAALSNSPAAKAPAAESKQEQPR